MLKIIFASILMAQLDQPPTVLATTKDDLLVQLDTCRLHLTRRGAYAQGWSICYDVQHALEILNGIRLPSGELVK